MDLPKGNAKEDTLLLNLATQENRILLTRDTELALRGKEQAVLVKSDDVMDQVQQLIDCGLICTQVDDEPLFAVQHGAEESNRLRNYPVQIMLQGIRRGIVSSGAISAANSTGMVRTGSIFQKELSTT